MLPTVQKKFKKSKKRLKRNFKGSKRNLAKAFKKVKIFYRKNPYASLGILTGLFLLLSSLIILASSTIQPNDEIHFLKTSNKAILQNKNPTFNTSFGQRDEPEKQWTRFEAKAVKENPFEEKEKDIFTQLIDFVSPKKTLGIELSLESVGERKVRTSTELVQVREVKKEDETYTPFEKQTVLNPDVVDGVDIEYQILEGMGLKEDIIIKDLEEYTKGCEDVLDCDVNLNEFVFDITLDSGLELRSTWYTHEGKSTENYYFTDSRGNYVAHFLPSWAIDNKGIKTHDVDIKVIDDNEDDLKILVVVDREWLFSEERVYPIRIDPTIVHDTQLEFDEGAYINTEYVTGKGVAMKDMPVCTGGTITQSGDYTIHTFTSSGTFGCDKRVMGDVLVVGGGGGGAATGSGGGAGGYIYKINFLVESGNTSVTVGTGGAGGLPNANPGTKGGNSIFSSLTAEGGGYGVSHGGSAGGDGGSGGGGPIRTATPIAPGGTASQGYPGGDGYVESSWVGNSGGGGGAGSAGNAGGNSPTTAKGGDGLANSISGSSVYYAGGGGGGEVHGSYVGAGGLGGGGSAVLNNAGGNGVANTGGGGAGGSYYTASPNYYAGGNGGTGVVIIRYKPEIDSGDYTSPSIDFGTNSNIESISWDSEGVNTGDGETPYDTTGLIAQWNFNETSGTTAVSGESCGTSCNGTLTNFANTTGQDVAIGSGWTNTHRRWGTGALMFDGTNDYVNTGTAVNIANQSFTIEAWAKRTITGSWDFILAQGTNTTNNGLHFGFRNTNQFICAFWGNDLDTPTTYTDSDWNHWVCTYNSNTKERNLYRNGEIVASDIASANYQGSGTLNIGARIFADSLYFNGYIDSTRIYNRTLTPSEILSNYQAGNVEFQYRTSNDGSTWGNWEGGSEVVVDNLHDPTVSGCTGGTVLEDGRVHMFKSSDTFQCTSSGNVEILVVAGGGGGGTNMGGGGGGGGVIHKDTYSISANTPITVTVGAGGNGAPSGTTYAHPTVPATNGANSIFGTLTAIGGGAGGTSYNTMGLGIHPGSSGGSGGGASGYNNNSSAAGAVTGGAGTAGQGHRGGHQGTAYYSGGGGGAGGPGADGNNKANGGDGYYTDILGPAYYWGGGGGGAGYSIEGGHGGAGGGGGGAAGTTTGGTGLNNGAPGGGGCTVCHTNTPGGDGGTNTGGGGGGGAHYWANNKGGDGGSGIVIVRLSKLPKDDSVKKDNTTSGKYNEERTNDNHAVAYWSMDESGGTGAYIKSTVEVPFATGGTVSYDGAYTVHRFNISDTFTVNGSGAVEYLIVGGGGGGGGAGPNQGLGGGGGGGGILTGNTNLTSNTYNILSGSGGRGSNYSDSAGGDGLDSSAFGLTAIGGGGGGNWWNASRPGGSGGGGGNNGTGSPGAAGTTGQGNNGGNGSAYAGSPNPTGGGGGGGYSAVGANGSGGTGGGGGQGYSINFDGTTKTFGSGGGGGGTTTGGTGGTNAGSGGTGNSHGFNGAVNTGSGGGGASDLNVGVKMGGSGGDGVVIIKYPTSYSPVTVNNHGTPTGTTFVKDGKVGGARSFNGSSDYIGVPYSPLLNPAVITVETWIKTSSSSTQTIVALSGCDYDQSPCAYSPYRLYMEQGYLKATLYNTASTAVTLTSIEIINDDNWHHVATSFGNGTATLHVDGQIVANSSLIGTMSQITNDRFFIGATWAYSVGPARYFSGIIDEVSIYKTVRTSEEIYESYRMGRDHTISKTLNSSTDLNNYTKAPFWIASDQLGTNLELTYGESKYASYEPDENTVGYWRMDEELNAEDPLLLNYHIWKTKTGQTGSVGDFSAIGDANENYHITATDPWGRENAIWEARPDSVSGPDGGWNHSTLPIDNSKMYRLSVWVNRKVTGDGNFYLGTHGFGTTDGVYNRDDGSNNTNPYFWVGIPSQNTWTLVVGHVWPAGTATGSAHTDSGMYTVSGGKIGSITRDFIWRAETTTSRHRSYLYYSTNTSTRQQWVYPRMDIIDGTQPSIEELLEGYEDWNPVKDSSGHNNHGTAVGTSHPEGKIGSARDFNGSSDYILTSSFGFDYNNISVEAWIKPSDLSSRKTVVDVGHLETSLVPQLEVGTCNGGTNAVCVITPGIWQAQTSNNVISTGEWNYIVYTKNGVGATHKIYVNGIEQTLVTNASADYTSSSVAKNIGRRGNGTQNYPGVIDEVRISNIARTATEIRQAYEVGRRSYPITVNFKAELQASNLITGSTDLSFTIDETPYGTTDTIENIDRGEKIIIKENYDGTEYIAQGNIATINKSTGATTVESWDTGSTFPSVGFSVYATVFKWQREYFDTRYPLTEDKNAVSQLTFRKTTDVPATFWIDDIKKAKYLDDNTGATFTKVEGVQYVQYKSIFSTWDRNISPEFYLTSASVQYNRPPLAPTGLLTESQTNPTGISIPNPKFSAIYNDDDTIDTAGEYYIQVNTQSDFLGTSMWDSGWTAMTSTAVGVRSPDITYNGNPLSYEGTTYYWRIKFKDNYEGQGEWSTESAYFTMNQNPTSPTSLLTEAQTNPINVSTLTPAFSAIFNDPDTGDTGKYYEINVNTQLDFLGTSMWNTGKTATTSITNGLRSPNYTYNGTALYFDASKYYWRIRFWDSVDNQGAWSSTANFTMIQYYPNAPSGLLVEGETNPQKMGNEAPKFSAIFNHAYSEEFSSYYQLQVNTSSAFTGTIMWDSTKSSMSSVKTRARCADIRYGGSNLNMDDTTYYWRIKFWDSLNEESSWSETANFTTTLPYMLLDGLRLDGIRID